MFDRPDYNPQDWYWVVGNDKSRAFSSKVGRYLDASQADPQRTTLIDTEENMIAVLRAANIPPYHRVAKSTIIARLTDVQLAAANSAFNLPENLRLRERWYAPDQPEINADDPESVGFVQAVGDDPSAVLAPE